MRKLTGKKIEIEEEVIICDFCKKVIDAPENMEGLEHSATLDFSFGYFSTRDEDCWQWDACNICADKIDKLLTKFKEENGNVQS